MPLFYLFLLAFYGGSQLLCSVQATPSSKTAYFGPTSLSNEVHPQLTISGRATLLNVTVTGSAILNGPAYLTNSRFQALQVNGSLSGLTLFCQTLEVNGPTQLTNPTINKAMQIRGPLTVNGGTLPHVEVAADTVTLKDVHLTSITFLPNHPDHPQPQTLILEGETLLTGDVIFESGQGRMRKAETSVLKGALTGGIYEDPA